MVFQINKLQRPDAADKELSYSYKCECLDEGLKVETGREELKKEREIMQLVAGLQLGPDEMERREMPPHMIRSRHGPRYDNYTFFGFEESPEIYIASGGTQS
ncbi:hypothetical protein RR48_00503 [Papilio machaon]|uniref:Uncharacterized protein n=1 Tax=Papilio machaon TaxID=76193 RepID=A0A0N1PKA4_PAPMA|nr:hypothetical protein RR48_00503 [Papilio machaon]